MSNIPNTPNGDFSGDANREVIVPEPRTVENYIANELISAKKSLTWTRIIALICVVGALIETVVVAGGFNDVLQPRAAANFADDMISQRVDDNSDSIKATIEEKAPELISQIPDQAINQLPAMRESLENNFQTSLTSYATSSSDQLNQQFSDYLDDHKDEVKDALAMGQGSPAVHQLGAGLSKEFIAALRQTQLGGGETAQVKFDSSLASLIEIRQKLDRLAANKGLTPQEKETRHAIAILAQTVAKQAAPLNVSQSIADSETAPSAP